MFVSLSRYMRWEGEVEGFFLNLACRVVLHQLKGQAVSEVWKPTGQICLVCQRC